MDQSCILTDAGSNVHCAQVCVRVDVDIDRFH